jgi:hypothetical protein
MKPRLPAVCGRSSNPGQLPQADECRLESSKPNGFPIRVVKEARGTFIRLANASTLLSVVDERDSQAFANGEQPGLEELRAPDGKHPVLEVDVARAQPQCFPRPKSCPVEQEKDTRGRFPEWGVYEDPSSKEIAQEATQKFMFSFREAGGKTFAAAKLPTVLRGDGLKGGILHGTAGGAQDASIYGKTAPSERFKAT